jgi:hypothetical protein
MARPERVELPTFWFVARRSIQLSYGRILELHHSTSVATIPETTKSPQLGTIGTIQKLPRPFSTVYCPAGECNGRSSPKKRVPPNRVSRPPESPHRAALRFGSAVARGTPIPSAVGLIVSCEQWIEPPIAQVAAIHVGIFPRTEHDAAIAVADVGRKIADSHRTHMNRSMTLLRFCRTGLPFMDAAADLDGFRIEIDILDVKAEDFVDPSPGLRKYHRNRSFVPLRVGNDLRGLLRGERKPFLLRLLRLLHFPVAAEPLSQDRFQVAEVNLHRLRGEALPTQRCDSGLRHILVDSVQWIASE